MGLDDNFFALGGDSILSLQVVARAMQAGWRLSPRLVFEHPTVAALAQVARVSLGTRADQAPLVGPVPLLPIQHWFFSHPLPAPHHFNQAIRVELPAGALPALDEAWLALQRHHDALRFRYTLTAEGWRQEGTAPETAAPASIIDLRALGAPVRPRAEERIAAAVQASLDLARGPVARAVVVLAEGRQPNALLVIHHLVVDGVSWRVLLSDFELASRQWSAGKPIVLPPKTSSVREWAAALAEAAAGEELGSELPFWLEASAPAAALPRDRAEAANTIRSSRVQQVSVSREDTQALLHDLPARGTANLLDALLAALVQSLAGWTGEETWRIDLEGHGREDVGEVDVSRTVGWLTSLYPVRLTAAPSPAATLQAVKRTLREVPRGGVGFGILRYLDAPSAAPVREAPPAEILVNYLGQADQAIAPSATPAEPSPGLRPVGGPTGRMRDPAAPREYLLEVNGIVAGGQLRLDWIYSAHFEPATVARLAASLVERLHALVVEGLAGAVEEAMVASDFRNAELDENELLRIARLLEGT